MEAAWQEDAALPMCFRAFGVKWRAAEAAGRYREERAAAQAAGGNPVRDCEEGSGEGEGMKKLICEVCGGDLRKENGVFICQGCGCQYSLEEVKKMMQGTAGDSAAGTASMGNTGSAEADGASAEAAKKEAAEAEAGSMKKNSSPAGAASQNAEETGAAQASFRKTGSAGAAQTFSEGSSGAGKASQPAGSDTLILAKNALDAGDCKKAEEYCIQVTGSDPKNWTAWIIQGIAAGRQSTGEKVRVGETADDFLKALDNCPAERRTQLAADCAGSLKELNLQLVKSCAQHFRIVVDEGTIRNLDHAVDGIRAATDNFLKKTGQKITGLEYLDCAVVINSELKETWPAVLGEYNANDHPDDYAYSRFIDKGDILIEGFKQALVLCGDKEDDESMNDLKIKIYKNLIAVQTEVKKSQSYRVEVNDKGRERYKKNKALSMTAKSSRQSMINAWKSKIHEIETEGAEKVAEAARIRREEYWKQNADLKTSLEAEKKSLDEQIADLNQEILAIPGEDEKKEIQGRIDSLNSEKKEIGLLKTRERKAVQDKIDAAEGELDAVTERMNKQRAEIENKIAPLKKRSDEIAYEFVKPR